jgi:hypothetical protein
MDTDVQMLGRRLVGRWATEATHPQLPGAVITGWSEFEWLDGEELLVFRSHYDHPEIPDAVAVLGDTDGPRMHYFDSRGVHRLYTVTATADGWTIVLDRDAPTGSFATGDAPFSQRVRYTFADDGASMDGLGQLSQDDAHWDDDLEITYRLESRPAARG